MTTQRTLADLEAAAAEVARLAAFGDSHELRCAEQHRLTTERLLRANGILPLDSGADIPTLLDRLHPNARHGSTVEHDGRRWKRWITPAAKNSDGKVLGWVKTWSPA